MSPSAVRRIDHACALLMALYVTWVLAAYPWLSSVFCTRTADVTLRRLTIVAEYAIAFPYTWMPVSLVLTWRAARAKPEAKILVLYGAFIVLCGWTHLLGALTIPWAEEGTTEPTRLYWLAMKLKTVTAAVSLAVARVTDKQRTKILALSDQEAELVRERDDANKQRADAERARADLAIANQTLAEINVQLEQARAAESQRAREQTERAGSAEARSEELERMVEELRHRDAEIRSKNVRIEAQTEALRTLRTPILMPLDAVLVSVLIGTLDSVQAADWMERLLDRIKDTRSRLVVFDMTELTFIDSGVAQLIIKIACGVKLLGAIPIVCGMQPSIAMTIVNQGIDLSMLRALPSLLQAIAMAAKDTSK